MQSIGLTVCHFCPATALLIREDCNDLLIDEIPDPSDKSISTVVFFLRFCKSLLEVHSTVPDPFVRSRIVHLTHFLVKGYVLMSRPGSGMQSNGRLSREVNENSCIAKLCLYYANFRNTWQGAAHQEDRSQIGQASEDELAHLGVQATQHVPTTLEPRNG